MGNVMNSGSNHRRPHGIRRNHPFPPPPPHVQPEIAGNSYVFAAASPYPSQYPNPYPNPAQHYHYAGYYHPPPAMPVHLPAPFDHHHPAPAPPPIDSNWVAGRYPYAPVALPPTPYIEHQKAVTIRNDVNIKKETLRIEPDEENTGKFLVAFTFDATVPGSITVMFFAKEGEDCTLIAMKESELKPVKVEFEQGLGQRFKQPSGTGIDASMLEEAESLGRRDSDVFPLAVKAASSHRSDEDTQLTNCQITQAMFGKEKDAYRVRVLKQILCVNGTRYELQEIYGTGNSVDTDVDGNDPGKECVICLSEPRDTTVLPCRHMCLCSGCAKVLRFQTSRCPICRQPVERLLEMKVGGGSED